MPQSLGGDQLCAMQVFNPNSGPQKHPTQPRTFSTLGVFFFNRDTCPPPSAGFKFWSPKTPQPTGNFFNFGCFFSQPQHLSPLYCVEISPAGVIFFLPPPPWMAFPCRLIHSAACLTSSAGHARCTATKGLLREPGHLRHIPWTEAEASRSVRELHVVTAREGAKTHRALHRARRAHHAHNRMQHFSAMYTVSESRQDRGENTLK